ncbi:MAG: glycosyltransferase family 2 protein [Gelidibacter sp.]
MELIKQDFKYFRMKDVSVIIINYNTAKFTVECVHSVVKHTPDAVLYEIIVVDNNSNVEDFNYLKEHFPYAKNIHLHRSAINTGFGGGNMFGTQYASAKYLLFLNNDAFLQNDCLSILYNYMETNTEIGVATAQNYNEHQEHVASFDHDKGIRKLIFGRSFLERHFSNTYPKRKKEYKEPVAVNFVNGAFMFFRSDAFARVGGFDTNIFLYFEEMDICYRMRQINFKSALVPEAKITHYQGASTGTSKVISKEGMISYMYVVKKNYAYSKYLFIRLYYCFTFLIKPKKWFLLGLVLKGCPLSESLKQKQTIVFQHAE